MSAPNGGKWIHGRVQWKRELERLDENGQPDGEYEVTYCVVDSVALKDSTEPAIRRSCYLHYTRVTPASPRYSDRHSYYDAVSRRNPQDLLCFGGIEWCSNRDEGYGIAHREDWCSILGSHECWTTGTSMGGAELLEIWAGGPDEQLFAELWMRLRQRSHGLPGGYNPDAVEEEG